MEEISSFGVAGFHLLPICYGKRVHNRILPCHNADSALGGYQSFSVAPWLPLGTTGVIRGDVRNADIIAEQPVSLLVNPKEIYMRYWYVPYSPMELKDILADEVGREA